MMGQWLVYGLAVSLLVSVAAWLAEQGAKAQRWPTRWIWVGAMVVSLAFPLAAWLAPTTPEAAPSVVAIPAAYVMGSIPVSLGAPSEAGLPPTTVALLAWAVLSALLLATIGVLAARLYRRRRGWSRRTVEGVDVWVSRRTGPAALGLIRGHVVVPEWALELDAERRRLLVLHEAEHVRARDPQLAVVALLVAVLVPWNLPLWWQLRRLRQAIEVDCDERVLRRTGDARGYGSLLLEVCHRKSHLAVALAESRSMLERRIRMITKATRGPATLRAVGLSVVSGLVLALACETPPPTSPADEGSNPLDLQDVRTALDDECAPALFVDGARAGRADVDALDPGEIEWVSVVKGAGLEVADGAVACGVVSVLTEGASVEEESAARRIVERVTAARREAAGQEGPKPQTLEEVQEGPTFTPMTVRPQLKNNAEVAERLREVYPPLLKEAGIGGTVNLWFLIDEEGMVQRLQINESSGRDELDQAAMKVAWEMEFTPAYNREQRVPAWLALDISFETEDGADAITAAREPTRPTGGEEPAYEAREVTPEPVLIEEREPVAEREAELSGQAGPEPTGQATPQPTGQATPQPTEEPVFTPMTERPRLLNDRETAERLESLYPPLLREAGIGGTTNVWFHIGEDGRVKAVRINESSGHEALDQAALKVAREMVFTPAKNGAETVDVWVALGITFATQR